MKKNVWSKIFCIWKILMLFLLRKLIWHFLGEISRCTENEARFFAFFIWHALPAWYSVNACGTRWIWISWFSLSGWIWPKCEFVQLCLPNWKRRIGIEKRITFSPSCECSIFDFVQYRKNDQYAGIWNCYRRGSPVTLELVWYSVLTSRLLIIFWDVFKCTWICFVWGNGFLCHNRY